MTRSSTDLSRQLLRHARALSNRLDRLRFGKPVAVVYNPLAYAWEPFASYLRKYARQRKRVVFLGMNPGPFGMLQTGVPFGEIDAVKNWLGIEARVGQPRSSHPKRPIHGFDCPRSEVSGRRLWGLFRQRFGSPERFFHHHIVLNYCPLAFFDDAGRNLTPDKLSTSDRRKLLDVCDAHLLKTVRIVDPDWLIGIGQFAAERARNTGETAGVRTGKILHPSPASPSANQDWAGQATSQLRHLGVWKGSPRGFP